MIASFNEATSLADSVHINSSHRQAAANWQLPDNITGNISQNLAKTGDCQTPQFRICLSFCSSVPFFCSFSFVPFVLLTGKRKTKESCDRRLHEKNAHYPQRYGQKQSKLGRETTRQLTHSKTVAVLLFFLLMCPFVNVLCLFFFVVWNSRVTS